MHVARRDISRTNFFAEADRPDFGISFELSMVRVVGKLMDASYERGGS